MGLEVRIRLTYPLPWHGTGGIGLLGWDLGLSTNGAGARNNHRMELFIFGDVATEKVSLMQGHEKIQSIQHLDSLSARMYSIDHRRLPEGRISC